MRVVILSAVLVALPTYWSAAAAAESSAEEILKSSGVKGGLVVHLHCGDGKLTAALRVGDAFLVHGLDTDQSNVEQARRHFHHLGVQGPVSADRFDGRHLPYADNLVNLLVAEDLGNVSMDEVTRVLVPRGVACVKRNGTWSSATKPWPDAIDEWTHFLHGPDNNAVAQDTRVAPPRHMQWVAGPRWARSHDHLASLSAAVSAGGRIFYIVDEGPVASVGAPSKWMLVARDAFNGVLLWKRRVDPWEDPLRPFRSGPTELPRRLVATGARVYVTLGYGQSVSALDAATGKVLQTFAHTENTHEILLAGGRLYLVTCEPTAGDRGTSADLVRRLPPWAGRDVYRQYVVKYPPKAICVVDAETGRLVWQKKDDETRHVLPTTLAVADGRVFLQNEKHLLALDSDSGEVQWRAERPVSLKRPGFSAPTLVVKDRIVLSADRSHQASANTGGTKENGPQWLVSPTMISTKGELIAFSAETGKRLWSAPCFEAFNSSVDVFVIDGKVWSGFTAQKGQPGIAKVYDLHTGEVVDTRPPDQKCFSIGFVHGRCYRNKATINYVLHGRAGVEFVDVHSHGVAVEHWIRGTCQYGILACNGLLYLPPHSCACYNEAKLNGLSALAPARGGEVRSPVPKSPPPLERGPAYKQAPSTGPRTASPGCWPTYRHDAARSGASKVALSPRLKPGWETSLRGALSAVVVADGRLYVAQTNAHTLHALDAGNGSPVWHFTAGGRIDSPPTVSRGRVYFGSADGWIYCLRAHDGAFVWRHRAAPATRQVVSFGQLESAWPVHGSVLVEQGSSGPVVYAVAGRSSLLDGGLYLIGLDARSGEQVFRHRMSDRDPRTGREPQETITGKRGTYMPGALPDVLSSDGSSVFMRHARFDLAGERLEPTVDHLFSAAGFLDDSWWHRTYWLIGTAMLPDYHGWPVMGCERIAGRLLVLDGDRVFGFGRSSYEKAGSHLGVNTSYHLFAADAKLGPPKPPAKDPGPWWRSFPGSRVHTRWTTRIPFYARAMALAGDTLFVAGPTKVVDFDAQTPAGDIRLWAVSAADGTKQAEYPLAATPVFDSLAVSVDGLYFATVDGRVVSFKK